MEEEKKDQQPAAPGDNKQANEPNRTFPLPLERPGFYRRGRPNVANNNNNNNNNNAREPSTTAVVLASSAVAATATTAPTASWWRQLKEWFSSGRNQFWLGFFVGSVVIALFFLWRRRMTRQAKVGFPPSMIFTSLI